MSDETFPYRHVFYGFCMDMKGGSAEKLGAKVMNDAFEREITVTPEMLKSGEKYYHEYRAKNPGNSFEECMEAMYRGMHALAPVELVPEGERQAGKERDELRAELARLRLHPNVGEQTMDRIANLVADLNEACASSNQHKLERDHILEEATRYVERINALEAENARLRAMLPEERAADYTGPKDSIHERAHEVIKDLMNGRIGQPTRDQIGKALGSSKPAPEPKPLPRGALRLSVDDRRKVGGW